MPTAQQLQAVFDFDSAIEGAAAALLCAQQLKAVTPASESKFQQVRPRVECIFVTGPAKPVSPEGNMIAFPAPGLPPNVTVNPNYQGQLQISTVTDAAEAAKTLHFQYRAIVRYTMALFRYLTRPQLNPDGSPQPVQPKGTLTNHVIQFVTEAGTTPLYKAEDGYWKSAIHFDVRFSIHNAALQALIGQ
jgi:hypothetical protein